MDQGTKQWLESEFSRLHEKIDNKVQPLQKDILANTERSTRNTRFVYMLTGGLILLSALLALITVTIDFNLMK